MSDVSGVSQGGPPSWLANLPDAVKRVFGYANPISPAQAAPPTGDPRLGSSVGVNAAMTAPPGATPVLPNVMPTGFGPSQGPPSNAAASAYTGMPPGVSTLAPTIDPTTGLPTSQGMGGGAPQPMPYAGGQGPDAGPGSRPDLAPYAPNSVAGWPSPRWYGGDQTAGPAVYGDPRIGTDQVGSGGPNGSPSLTPRPKGGGGSGRNVTINPRARAQVPPAGANQGTFRAIDAPNANPGTGGGMMGGALARSGSRPIITALDLPTLFGRR